MSGEGPRGYLSGEEGAGAAPAERGGGQQAAAVTAGPGVWAQHRGRREPEGGRPSAVTMETPSTGDKRASQFDDYEFADMTEDDAAGTLYTSLISSDQDRSTYFSGILQEKNKSASHVISTKDFSIGVHTTQEAPIFETRGLFSSDSGIEMTPAENTEVNKILVGPAEQEKVETCKYIDIRQSEQMKYKDLSYMSSDGGSVHVEESASEPQMKIDNMSEPQKKAKTQYENLSEELTFLPYMDEACDSAGLHRASSRAVPVTITLTEMEYTTRPDVQETALKRPDVSLRPSPDVVPTVTVSEPEDDSPGSLTPSSSGTDPSASDNIGKYNISEDELISAIKAKDFPIKTYEEDHAPPSLYSEIHDVQKRSADPAALDNEASSADSGDSEIELVSEDQLTSEEAMHSTYMTFSHIGGPPPSPASPSIQYSILREEREAELDSELIIESCNGSSASEESPKREHDSPLMKPFHMDIIEEENGSRNEGTDADDFEANNLTESKMNRENLSESASYMKCTFAASEVKLEPPHSKTSSEQSRENLAQKNPAEASIAKQSRASLRDSGKKSPTALAPMLFLNKKIAVDLLHWRDLKQSGIVFGSVLLMLFSLTQFSVVSVIAYLALAALSATISFRIYKSVLQAVQKTDEGHPFKPYLEMEISLSQEQIQKYTDCIQCYMNSTVKELRRLFLVQDLVDSLKFAVLMWLLTYVGALFNGLTLLIMAVVSMFSLPAVYDKYQPQIDQYLGLMRTHINAVVAKIQAKIPGAKRKEE